jgi:hypothetical protein
MLHPLLIGRIISRIARRGGLGTLRTRLRLLSRRLRRSRRSRKDNDEGRKENAPRLTHDFHFMVSEQKCLGDLADIGLNLAQIGRQVRLSNSGKKRSRLSHWQEPDTARAENELKVAPQCGETIALRRFFGSPAGRVFRPVYDGGLAAPS